ncbi:zinc finger protein 185 isoform X2 [Toxotes jaculatrix]|uniref:zinc finger protein 185 isoform X2 n=1 Tax=Toxotes jaculatrix TaxID=941984 RepID=UPI001B3A7C59|nr:zinc finger protein 185 isoform X2 [Toxotes jaculatrix]
MSNKGDRAAVFRTTKVRTKLKGDGSWLQRRSEPQAETEEEKPWIAEVRASRLNGAPTDTSPVSSPTTSTPPPTKPDTERAPATGYLIRGVFTKLEDKPASSSTSNGFSGTTQFNKKPSESYKKIALHTVRPTSETQESQLSQEEQERRKEAASNVLKKSAVRQRSYVLSAAKKYDSKEKAPDTPLVNSSPSFVAKRVEITDDDESNMTPAPASSPAPSPVSPVAPVTSVASAPQPKPRKIVDTSVKTAVNVAVDEPVAPKVEETAPEPVQKDPAPVSVTEKDPFEDVKPGCTKVATPLPELVPVCVEAVCAKPEPEDSGVSGKAGTPLVKLVPALPTPAPTTTPPSPAPAPTVPEPPAPVSAVTAIAVKTESEPEVEPGSESEPQTEPEPEPEQKPEPKPEPESTPSPKPSSSGDTLTALYDTLIPFDTSSTSFKDDEPVLAKEEGGSADSHTTENSVEKEPEPALSNCEPITDDLLALDDSPEESAEPVPPSPGRWSQDLLSALDSEAEPAKTSGTLDLLADDIILINTEARSLSTQREEEKQTDETAKETQSPTETVTITTTTVIITDKSEEDRADPWSSHVTTTVTASSSADPFDPYPIGTTSPNSSSDLLQPLADISINSAPAPTMENKDSGPETNMSGAALTSLADDIIPIDTDTTSPSTQSQRSWARTWETSTPQQTNAEESQEPEPEGQAEDQQTLIMFERKSTENDSPWDRWTSPTVYTVTTTTGEEEEEEEEEKEESPEDTQTQTVTTTTTIREMHSEPEPAMDRTVTEEDRRVQTPEPEGKKAFVYVKEYVNATELSLHNTRDTMEGKSDYLTSSSVSDSFSSPPTHSSGSLSSTCTYCGEQVGHDARITIEHLNINCHPDCFKCAVCSKPMGDLLYSMFIHGGKVHCECCYSKALD